MLRSIQETKKLFTIEGLKSGQVDIKASKHLLSLSEDKQIEVLTNQLEILKKDFAEYDSPGLQGSNGQNDDVDKMQLRILIQVIEGLLAQI